MPLAVMVQPLALPDPTEEPIQVSNAVVELTTNDPRKHFVAAARLWKSFFQVFKFLTHRKLDCLCLGVFQSEISIA